MTLWFSHAKISTAHPVETFVSTKGSAEAIIKAGLARRVGLLMEYQKRKLVLQKVKDWIENPIPRIWLAPNARLCGDGF